MKNYLEKIVAIPGVHYAVVANNKAAVIDRLGENPHTKEAEAKIIFHALQMLVAVRNMNRNVEDADFLFLNGRFLFFNFDKLNLFVFCRNSVKISLLRMTVNVVMNEALNDKKVKKIVEKNIIDGNLLLRESNLDKTEKELIEAILKT
jgi:predicted membrane protein